MKVLFISRAYPPVVGGLENQNFALSRWLPTVAETEAIVNRHGKKALPLFLPWAAMTAAIRAGNADVVLLGDGLLACVGWFIKLFHRHKPMVAVLYGLDITYSNPLYQRLWPGFFFRNLDYFITISKATAAQAAASGVDAGRLTVIPSGIEADIPYLPSNRGILEETLGISLAGRRILLTVGRLVRRKGVAWFIEEVVPRLEPEVMYLVAGDGPERQAIEAKVVAMSLGNRVRVLGAVDEYTKQRLYAGSDLFIQPNIPVSGDMEGFGIVVLEAGLQGLPVVAAKLEGLQDAVHDGENGWLVPPADAAAFAVAIERALLQMEEREARRARLREYVRKNFSWGSIIQRYSEVLRGCLQEGGGKVAGMEPTSPKADKSLQTNFSLTYAAAVYDRAAREQKARKVLAILQDHLGALDGLHLLDIGCSTGFMTRQYAGCFDRVTAVDVDVAAVAYAGANSQAVNLNYLVMDSQLLSFPDAAFDAVTCTHIYEHVPDAGRLMAEIHRVLKPGGVCFFSAGNRLSLMEPHYRLPLLSVVPKWCAHWYLRVLGRGRYYYETHLSYWGLRNLVRAFEIVDYTCKVVDDPQKYAATDMIRPGTAVQKLVRQILRHAYWASPTYLWVLKKGG